MPKVRLPVAGCGVSLARYRSKIAVFPQGYRQGSLLGDGAEWEKGSSDEPGIAL